MGFDYTFAKEPIKLGDYDEQFGQSYWGTVNEHLQPIKFNSKQKSISVNDKITAEERSEKRSGKGTDYYQLRGVKVMGDITPTTASVATSNAQLDRIEAKIDKLMGVNPEVEVKADPIITDIGETISLDEIPF